MCSLDTAPLPLTIEEAVIHNNRQREKTMEVKAREFKKLKEIEAERGKLSQGKRTDLLGNLPKGNSPVNARETAAAKVGMSGKTSEKAAVVVDKIDELESQGHTEEAQDLKRPKRTGKVLRFPVFYPQLHTCTTMVGPPPPGTGAYGSPAPYGIDEE